MHLEGVSEAEISEINIPTGVPRRYRFADDFSVTDVGYLGDAVAIEAAAAAVARQAGG
jgi:2,3-bisphosphoglycerate-dependent phosphoglycerate mutase